MGLDIRYMAGEVGALDIGTFDLVTCLEVIEHVADKPAFLREVAARLTPGGLLVMSTPNRTAASRVLLVGAAEAVGYVPRGTHHWEDFVTPDELEGMLAEAGLRVTARRGIAWHLGKGLHLADDMSLNYILSVQAA
jgi:2-polyprenyl-6-hydroxyphenyl methylase/3-demethylubiquinone-9 3-methyltransferase